VGAPKGCIVGLGVMGSNHLRVLGGMNAAEVVAVVDPSPERRAGVVERYRDIRAYATLAEAIGQHELDFACLAAPPERLPELALEAIAAGIAVLVEKPLAQTIEQAQQVVAAAAESGVPLTVGYVERFNPAVRELKRRLDDGAVGRVLQMHARRLSPFPNRQSASGVAVDLATHDIDVMRYLSGGDVVRVYAETAQRIHTTAEDLLCASLRFDDDSTGVLEVNWITPTKVRQLSITGETGMFVVDYLMQDLSFYENPRMATEWDALQGVRGMGEGDMVRYALARREPLALEWEAFLEAFAGRAPIAVTGEDALAALATARAIQESGDSHMPVRPAVGAAPGVG
jgi:predicted dehydrogenase